MQQFYFTVLKIVTVFKRCYKQQTLDKNKDCKLLHLNFKQCFTLEKAYATKF